MGAAQAAEPDADAAFLRRLVDRRIQTGYMRAA